MQSTDEGAGFRLRVAEGEGHLLTDKKPHPNPHPSPHPSPIDKKPHPNPHPSPHPSPSLTEPARLSLGEE